MTEKRCSRQMASRSLLSLMRVISSSAAKGTVRGFANGPGLALLAVAAAGLVLFIIAERRSAHPMFDFSVLRIHRFNGVV